MSEKTIFLGIQGTRKFVTGKDEGNDSPQPKEKEELVKTEFSSNKYWKS